ncbi:MAG: TlpA family protein disulfide reductase [Actinomycetota bacterium]|nr:TlpA family protein disulfide reductase [Actinomycetota bacterium]
MSRPLRWGASAASLVVAAVVPLGGCSTEKAVAFAPVTTVAGSTSAPPRSPTYPLGVTEYAVGHRSPMPPLTGPTLSGARLSTAGLHGHVVVLTVWASWCQPCQGEMKDLAPLARRQDLSTVRFVGLDEHDTATAAANVVQTAGLGYPQLVDDGALLARLSPWLPDAVPGSLVLDGVGRVAARVVGQVTADQLHRVLDRVGV